VEEVVRVIFGAPVAKILIVAGLTLLLIASVGGVAGKFQPGTGGRILAGFSAPIVLVIGLALQLQDVRPEPPATPEGATLPPAPPTAAVPLTAGPPTTLAVRWTADQVQVFMNSCVFQYLNTQPWCVCFLGKLQTRYTFQEVDAILRNGAVTNLYPNEYLRFIQECNLGR
jgi:hypothetical protein